MGDDRLDGPVQSGFPLRAGKGNFCKFRHTGQKLVVGREGKQVSAGIAVRFAVRSNFDHPHALDRWVM